MNPVKFSIIIPAKNEEAMIVKTLKAVFDSILHYCTSLHEKQDIFEVILVDNNSTDKTREYAEIYNEYKIFQYLHLEKEGAARARNFGTKNSKGNILIFIDADTIIPLNAFVSIRHFQETKGFKVGIFKLNSLEGGMLANIWWFFWNQARRLPIPKAKALPAFMYCTRDVFAEFGPFNEDVHIAEEWPITAEYYRKHPRHFIYAKDVVALSSNRRMALQKFGYLKTFLKYVWAVLHKSGRKEFTNKIRHADSSMIKK